MTMPDMIEASSGSGNDYFYAITGSSTVLFYGGYTTSPGLSGFSYAGIVAAVNSETNARIWASVYDVDGYAAKFVSGLAYNSHTNRVAVYAQQGADGSEGTKEIDQRQMEGHQNAYLYVLSAIDGTVVSDFVKIVLDSDTWISSSSAMHLSRHNKVTIAFRRPDSNIGATRILRWDSTSSTTLDFDYFSDNLGQITSLFVVEDASEANQHTFAGGAYQGVDGASSGSDRRPAIFHFKDKTGQTHKFLEDANIDSECKCILIDNLKLDSNYLFGTTRCTNKNEE